MPIILITASYTFLPHIMASIVIVFKSVGYIYPWAGQLRSVDIYQNDVRFCHFAYLETEGNAVMQRLEEEDWAPRKT